MAEVVGDCKQVQELVEKGEDEVADAYIWKGSSNSNYGPIDLNVPLGTDIPVVDLSHLTSSSLSAMDAELQNLRSALASWGCFQAINHGIETSFLDEVRELSRKFFHLTMEEKQKYARPKDEIEGYGNDMVLFENQSLDWNDRLYLLVGPEDQQKLQYWPENPDSFRSMLHEYIAKTKKIQELLLRSIASSLSLPDDCLLKLFGNRPVTYARFTYYPPCKRPDRIIRVKPHADGSGITILLQDKEVEGLQIMTNGIVKSPIHRVVTNTTRNRNTLGMFCAPDAEQVIGPLEELVDQSNPRLYNKTRNYLNLYFHYYQQGRRPIETVKI